MLNELLGKAQQMVTEKGFNFGSACSKVSWSLDIDGFRALENEMDNTRFSRAIVRYDSNTDASDRKEEIALLAGMVAGRLENMARNQVS